MSPPQSDSPDAERRRPTGSLRRLASRRGLLDATLFLATINLLSIPLAAGFRLSVGSLTLSSPPLGWSLAAWATIAALRFLGPVVDLDHARRTWAWLVDHGYLVAIAALTLIGLLLRIHNIDFGMPLIVHPDEHVVVGVALAELKTGWFDPGRYTYPTFFMNLMLPALAIYYVYGHGKGYWTSLDQVQAGEPGFYLVGRYHSAVLGALTIPLTYLLARSLLGQERGRRAGLIAGSIVAFSFIHVRESRFAVTDAPTAAVATAALVAIAGMLHRRSTRDYLVAGFLCGLAGSTKYTALPIALPFLAAHLMGRPAGSWLGKPFWIGLGAIPLGFIAGSPYALLNWRPFLQDLGWLSGFAGNPTPDEVRSTFLSIVGYASESGFGVPVFAISMVAIALTLYLRRREELLLVAFILGSIPQMTYSTHAFFPRFLVPLVPAVAVLVGGLIADALNWLENNRYLGRRAAAAAVAAAMIVLPWPTARENVQHGRFIGQQDSRTEAYLWIREQFPDGATIASEIELAGMAREYRLIAWANLHRHGMEEFEDEEVDVVVFSAERDRTFLDTPQALIRRQLRAAFGEGRRFAGEEEQRPGPTMEVFLIHR